MDGREESDRGRKPKVARTLRVQPTPATQPSSTGGGGKHHNSRSKHRSNATGGLSTVTATSSIVDAHRNHDEVGQQRALKQQEKRSIANDEHEKEKEDDGTAYLKLLRMLKQYPHSSEFTYLTRKHHKAEQELRAMYNPYLLSMVPFSYVDENDFYTMSSRGIAHCLHGQTTDFTSLEQWEREVHLFHAMKQLKMFKFYRQWKSMGVWRKGVRRAKINRAQTSLSKHLFVLNTSFQESIAAVKKECLALESFRLHCFSTYQHKDGSVSLYDSAVYSLDGFLDAANSHKQYLLTMLSQFAERVRSIAASACDAAMQRLHEELSSFNEPGQTAGTATTAALIRSQQQQQQQLRAPGSKRGSTVAATTANGNNKSSNGSSALSYTMAAARRSEQRRLVAFVRMLDYMISDTLHRMLVQSISEMLQKVTGNQPVFSVDILQRGDADGLGFEPSTNEFQFKVEETVNSFMDTIAVVPRMLGHADLNGYLQSSELDSPVPFTELVDDDEHQSLLSVLKDSLSKAFSAAEQHKATFHHLHEMVCANARMLTSQFEQEYKDGSRTLENFREDIMRLQQQRSDMQNLAHNSDVGIVRIQTQTLKDQLLPSPQSCLKEICSTQLPSLAIGLYNSFINQVHDAKSRLSARLNSVEDFVNQVSFLDSIKERKQELEDREREIHNVFDVIAEFDVPIDDEQYAAYQTMRQDFNDMKSTMEDADASREDNIKKFSNELQNQVERIGREVSELMLEAQNEMFLSKDTDRERAISKIEDIESKVQAQRSEAERIRKFQQLFRVPESKFEELEELEQEIWLKRNLWTGQKEFETLTGEWCNTTFDRIDADEMEEQVQRYHKLVMKLERGLPKNDVVPRLKEKVERFKNLLPVIHALRNKAMQKRHWQKVEHVLDQVIEHDEDFTLQKIIDLGAPNHKDEISQISTEATQEDALEDMLRKVVEKWEEIEFTVVPYKESKDTFILGSVDEIQAALDESQVTMTTILSSRFVSGIRHEVERVEKQLNTFSETLDEWLNVQKNWMYLESIFSAPDIQKQLPQESKQFFAVDKQYRDIMRKTKEQPNALKAGTSTSNLHAFQRANETLDRIQKNLEDYLEKKRIAFPRFYFLSNDELLEILAETRNVQAVQPHMSKCFDGINRLDFGNDPKSIDIYAMLSAENERVELPKNLKARGNVENWLDAVEKSMISSLKRLTKEAYLAYSETPRNRWVLEHPAQIVILVSQIYWCQGVVECLDRCENATAALESFLHTNKEQLRDLTALVRSDLSDLKRKIIVALITIDVHARDIVEELISEGVQNTNEFRWQMQLRFYWDTDYDIAEARQTNWRFPYAYEYLGAQPRLVVTPMTDRCYLTLTGAMSLNLGGAPQGPAGTGKTETTKDLGKAVGVQCVVFNCSENLDYKFMAKFFSGLAQCGAWACFDEFNRIDVEVLSVVAQQLRTILNGLKAQQKQINFEGHDIKLASSVGVFITMNPGYAGRTELPDNLKALFRPMAMMIPDYALVAEVMLFAEGFETSKELSRKMVKLYKLASEQLSQQDHYDFGMRALKSVLVMAGSLKRSSPEEDEQEVLIRAMCDSNLPKFLREDAELFNAIVRDLFPNNEVHEKEFGALQQAVHKALDEHRLQRVPAFITKALQLFETMNVRFGVMIVGPTGSGKSTLYTTLQRAVSMLREEGYEDERFQKVHSYPLNPKCISMGELYGEYNLLTSEWNDGLASTLIRDAVNDTTDDKKWTVFDGPVDALWIESMNTVLDDNCTLCLPNGERIKLKPNTMRMLFEVEDLAYASPATVSRCGMVYMPSEEVGWQPLIRSWAQTKLPEEMPQNVQEYLASLIEQHTDEPLSFVRSHCTEHIPSVNVNLVASLCNLVESLIVPMTPETRESGMIDYSIFDENALKERMEKIYLFALVWSVGGNIVSPCWEDFDAFMRDNITGGVGVNFPPKGLVYDYYVDVTENSFRHWSTIVPDFKYDKSKSFFEFMVPNIDTTRFSYIFECCLKVKRSVFFTGSTGVGKSIIANDFLSRKAEEGSVSPVLVNFSAQTSSKETQQLIESKLEKQRKNRLGPAPGGHIVIFVDDVNMPARERYGAQPPIELLRLLLDYKGFYDRDKLFWKDIVDTTLTAACAPPGGGRQQVTGRFFRHFNMLNVPSPSDGVLDTILSSILHGFLQDFPDDFNKALKPIVSSSISLFRSISVDLLPTPAKSHYLFNTRDLSNLLQGVLMIRPSECQNMDTMKRLWVHESTRVFCDRLVSEEDREYFRKTVSELVQRYFPGGGSYDELFGSRKILFGDFMKMGVDVHERRYEEIADRSKLTQTLESYLEEYNLNSRSPMSLVFFLDAAEHTTRLARILRQPRGSAMLVGVGGSGKQSLTRFASFMCGFHCYQVELTRNYGPNEFREDLKQLYYTTGVKGHQTTFLFTDSQIVRESFLEDINNLLNSGEVPGLYAQDEREQILSDPSLIAYAQQQGIPESRDSLYKAFINRVRSNLHIILCMSPVGSAFRTRCRQFPSLINCCTIDWYTEWPDSALHSVSARFLADQELQDEQTKDNLCKMCVDIHTSVKNACGRMYNNLSRPYYITPKSYLDLINLYIDLLATKRKELNESRDRLLNGLQKLDETNNVVDDMKKQLNDLQPQLEKKKEDTAQLIEHVNKDQAEAERVQANVAKDEEEVKKQQQDTQAIKDDAQADLDQALPALERAKQSLDALKKDDITEIKSFPKPPQLVQLTMEAVNTVLGEKTDWETAKKVVSDTHFIDRLKETAKNAKAIQEKTLKALKRYIEHPSFDPDEVGKQSKASKSLCMWCQAIDKFCEVQKVVKPKEDRLAEAEASLQDANAKLKEKQDELSQVQAQVDNLRSQLKQAQEEQRNVQEQADLTQKRLERAEKLTSGLADEQVRWKQTTEEMAEQAKLLIGDVFVSSACISYIGAFTGEYRDALLSKWIERCKELGIPVSDSCSLSGTLASPVEVREWNIWGLPSDRVSVDNGVLATRGRRWPLMIDPQGQANNWVKNMEAKNGLRTIKLSDANYLRTLENSIRVGNPVLIEDVGETLDPALDPVLQKAIFTSGGRKMIRMGDTDVDYDDNFRLYITTKNGNPHYLPEICIKVTLINFTVTLKGLEDQLLGDVVRKERPDLEEQRDGLIVSISNDKKQLKELEDKILRLLKESEGNILDDEDLISTLNNSKRTSGIIQERLKDAEETERSIDDAREEYRPAATRGSVLYFVIADLPLVGPMYQYSLTYFMNLFNYCIENSETSFDGQVSTRLNNLMEFTTSFIFTNVSRGLFEEHKVLFAFQMATSIAKQDGDVSHADFAFLLRGATGVGDAQRENPVPYMLNERAWQMVEFLHNNISEFYGLATDIEAFPEHWQAWRDSKELQAKELPRGWSNCVKRFQQMLPVKVFREEKVLHAIEEYVNDTLGKSFTSPPQWTLESVFKDTDCKTPIIFVLTQGADPTGMLQRFAEKKGWRPGEKLHMVSLGQGQGAVAENAVAQAQRNGEWVCLQNCHLASSWMVNLERMVEEMTQSNSVLHQDFRLWLTSMPSSIFPTLVLQNGIKLTNEPPKGMKANVYRTFNDMSAETFEAASSKPFANKKLLFSLAMFHAAVQERRKFGALGFNIPYEFSNSDLECSQLTMQMYLEQQEGVPWNALVYVVGQINYGGRVTDDIDRRCLMSILKQYLTPEVLDESYTYTASGVYRPPKGCATLQECLEHISNTFPSAESPDVFGMHDNADINFQSEESRRMLDTLLLMQPKAAAAAASASGGNDCDDTESSSSDSLVEQQAAQIEAGLEAPLTYDEAIRGLFDRDTEGNLRSLSVVLSQEMERFNRLRSVLKRTLSDLQKAVKGFIVMSDDLESMYTSLLNSAVPELWKRVAYPSLRPLGSWIKDYHARISFFRTWLHEGTPRSFWLPGFFFPQGFLTGILQQHSRQYRIPIDSLQFSFEVMPQYEDATDVREPARDGVYMHGMFIDGARWDRENNVLDDAKPGVMYDRLPVVHFKPSQDREPVHLLDEATWGWYECPLYKTPERAGTLSTTGQSTNFICCMSLPTRAVTSSDTWTLRGVAAICSTRE